MSRRSLIAMNVVWDPVWFPWFFRVTHLIPLCNSSKREKHSLCSMRWFVLNSVELHAWRKKQGFMINEWCRFFFLHFHLACKQMGNTTVNNFENGYHSQLRQNNSNYKANSQLPNEHRSSVGAVGAELLCNIFLLGSVFPRAKGDDFFNAHI